MGMSAGQARLLSITAKLTDNELRSQMITNSKLRLADKSSEASGVYMDALNSQQLIFKTYNDNGNASSSILTPAVLYTYEPLKNQYSIQNSAGQNLVSPTDARNFEESNSLYDFLDCYNLIEQDGLLDDYNEQLKYYNDFIAAYNKYLSDNGLYNQYLTDLAQYNADMEQYNIDYSKYQADYAKYLQFQSLPDLYQEFSSIVGTSSTATGSGSSYCYYMALNGNSSCYLHILNLLLDFDGTNVGTNTYDTSAKDASGNALKVTTNGNKGGTYNNINNTQKDTFKIISDALNTLFSDGNAACVCDGDDDFDTPDSSENLLKQIRDSGGTPTDLQILQSDYIEIHNEETDEYTYSLKSLKQKAIDMYYIISNNLVTDPAEMRKMLINFTDGDMQKIDMAEPVEPVRPTEPAVVAEPVMPDIVEEPIKPRYDIILNDKQKAQWYINLWYLMNGSESANKVELAVEDNSNSFSISNDYKNESKQNYKIIDGELLTSKDWLQFAMSNGIVTLKQASYFNPSINSGKVAGQNSEGITWQSIIYTNASDIVSQEDEAAIALAEVKYKNAITEIENQDKKYDQDLKKLDTEHSALQTEYESLKSTIDKNVERSFKAFS